MDRTPTGPHDDLTDVPGLRVGHTTHAGGGRATGCTVVLADPACPGGVDVRGGGPGTRETDLLDPRNLVDRVDAIVLAGGSAYGLRAADGVMDGLRADGRGWPVGDGPGQVVPIVPAAIIFDLGEGEPWLDFPSAQDGRDAYASAASPAGLGPVALGRVGAGTGARVNRRTQPGGLGSASQLLEDGTTVAALVVVNALGAPHGAGPGSDVLTPGTATTIGVVGTDAALTKTQCATLARVAHDGLARAIDPAHTAYDGDTFFALATGSGREPDPLTALAIEVAAAHCVARAIAKALGQEPGV